MAAACPHCGRPSPAGTSPIVTAPPPAREETLWRGRPSARVLIGRALAAVVVLAVGGFITWGLQAGPIGWTITALTVLVIVIALAIRWIQLRATLYAISNQRVIVERGILSKSVEEIDLRYIEDTRFFQSFLERILGIGNVTLVSADKTTPTFVLFHITEPRQIRELVRSQAYQVSQRQVFTRMT
jgi:uncharacterized membrane protein YdbT with pleckstrin-like domain